MEKQASEFIKENVLASVRLECPQLIRDMISSSTSEYDSSSGSSGVEQAIGGIAGKIFGSLATGSSQKSSLGEGGVYFIVVGPTKLAFFSIKHGLLKSHISKMLGEFPRSDLITLEVKKGYMSKVRFIFKDGTSLELMCSRMMRGKLNKMEQVLRGIVSER